MDDDAGCVDDPVEGWAGLLRQGLPNPASVLGRFIRRSMIPSSGQLKPDLLQGLPGGGYDPGPGIPLQQ
jgi:hypothetical protein